MAASPSSQLGSLYADLQMHALNVSDGLAKVLTALGSGSLTTPVLPQIKIPLPCFISCPPLLILGCLPPGLHGYLHLLSLDAPLPREACLQNPSLVEMDSPPPLPGEVEVTPACCPYLAEPLLFQALRTSRSVFLRWSQLPGGSVILLAAPLPEPCCTSAWGRAQMSVVLSLSLLTGVLAGLEHFCRLQSPFRVSDRVSLHP